MWMYVSNRIVHTAIDEVWNDVLWCDVMCVRVCVCVCVCITAIHMCGIKIYMEK